VKFIGTGHRYAGPGSLAGREPAHLRFYERVGILPRAPRGPSGYRTFDASAVERIKLVKQLQELSLTLDDVNAMIAAVRQDDVSCRSESSRIEAQHAGHAVAVTPPRSRPRAPSPSPR
jgi:DNA-binding transcriptional MerR regulator